MFSSVNASLHILQPVFISHRRRGSVHSVHSGFLVERPHLKTNLQKKKKKEGYIQTRILKSSKHFTRSWRRRGDGVTKQLHRCFSQTLHNYTQNIKAQSHLLHTLSLPLSIPHTHMHTTHHTHTYTEQIRQIWANQILGGWRDRFLEQTWSCW